MNTLHTLIRPAGGWCADALGFAVSEAREVGGSGSSALVVPLPGSPLPEGRLVAVGGRAVACAADVRRALAALRRADPGSVECDVRALVKVYDVALDGEADLGLALDMRALAGLRGRWARVAAVGPGSAADRAGVAAGCFVTVAGGAAVCAAGDVAAAARAARACGATTVQIETELRPWELWCADGEGEAAEDAAPSAARPRRGFGARLRAALRRVRPGAPPSRAAAALHPLISPPPVDAESGSECDVTPELPSLPPTPPSAHTPHYGSTPEQLTELSCPLVHILSCTA